MDLFARCSAFGLRARSPLPQLGLLAKLALAAATIAFVPACRPDTHRPSEERTGCNAAGNPLDEVLCQEFAAAGWEPVTEAPEALCTRAFVDLLGVRPSRTQLEERCLGRDFEDVVRSLQKSEEYRLTQRRRWADRFQYSDYTVDVASIRTLDALVDDLYADRIGYAAFAEVALSHPGFVGRHIGYGQPDMVAEAAFRAFLGRSATAPERADLANLWKPWLGNAFVDGPPPMPQALVGNDAGGVFGYGMEPMIDPFACEAGVSACESTMLGHASIEFPREGREGYITASDLTDADWHALREPGRLFTSLPMFWENEVDEVLHRYLGYDLGTMRPFARQRLVEYFRATGGDLRKLERAVLTSWAYRLSTDVEPERPGSLRFLPLAYGPTKPMIPETFLRSLGALTGETAGDCDWRYPNLPEWYYPGNPDLDEALDDVYPRNADGTIDRWFRDIAIQMGGCPGTIDFNTYTPRVRSHHIGLMTAVAQEEAVIELCFVRDATGLLPLRVRGARTDEAAIRETARHVLERALGGATDAEVDAIVQARLDGCAGCSAEAVARDLCAGLANGTEFLFY